MDIQPQPYLASQVVCSVDLKGFLCKFSIIVLYWITSIYCLGGIYANYDYTVHLSDDQVLIVLILMYCIHVHYNNNRSYCIGIIFIYYLIMIIQNQILYFLQIHIWQRTLNCANLYDFAIWFTLPNKLTLIWISKIYSEWANINCFEYKRYTLQFYRFINSVNSAFLSLPPLFDIYAIDMVLCIMLRTIQYEIDT